MLELCVFHTSLLPPSVLIVDQTVAGKERFIKHDVNKYTLTGHFIRFTCPTAKF